jgi:hypothetical protein
MAKSVAKRSPRRRNGRLYWEELTDQELLSLRFKDLGLGIERTWVKACLDQLNREIGAKGLKVKIHGWVSDEWFSPDNTPGIAFPFYLMHPRLMKLERNMVFGVEGGQKRDCMRILRHEAGHVLQHAYHLQKRRRWQQLFGPSSTPYPDYYKPKPSSSEYVQHLSGWYAQCHPDEDFAETFATWLSPRSAWRAKYAEWPGALEKLLYVDELMAEIAGEKPILTNRVEVDPTWKLSRTLGEHYERKTEHYAVSVSPSFDRDLQSVFTEAQAAAGSPGAAVFIKRNRVEIRESVARRTGESQVTVDAMLDDMSARCRALKLRAKGSEIRLKREFKSLVAEEAARSLFSRRRWFAV